MRAVVKLRLADHKDELLAVIAGRESIARLRGPWLTVPNASR
jgi:hypothetical protein